MLTENTPSDLSHFETALTVIGARISSMHVQACAQSQGMGDAGASNLRCALLLETSNTYGSITMSNVQNKSFE